MPAVDDLPSSSPSISDDLLDQLPTVRRPWERLMPWRRSGRGGDDPGELRPGCRLRSGCLLWLLLAVLVLVFGVVFFWPDDDGDDEVSVGSGGSIDSDLADCFDFGGPPGDLPGPPDGTASVTLWGIPGINQPCVITLELVEAEGPLFVFVGGDGFPPAPERPVLFASADVGTNHTDQAPVNPLTGQRGNSTGKVPFVGSNYRGDSETIARLSLDCSGVAKVAETLVSEPGVYTWNVPLDFIGEECRYTAVELEYDGQIASYPLDFLGAPGFVVPEAESMGTDDQVLELAGSLAWLGEGGDRPLATDNWYTTQALTGVAPDPDCTWYVPGDYDFGTHTGAIDFCEPGATASVHVGNDAPIEGRSEAATLVLSAGYEYNYGADISSFVFGDSAGEPAVYPCGAGQLGVTACADPKRAPEGDVALVTMTTAGAIALDEEAARAAVYKVEFETGEEYSIAASGLAEFEMTAPADSAARAVVRNNALTFVVPWNELDGAESGFRTFVTEGDQTVASPAEDGRFIPIVSTLTPDFTAVDAESPDEPVEGTEAETVEEFAAQLSASIASGDPFALDRLHPLVIESYSLEQCSGWLDILGQIEFRVEVLGAGDPRVFTWELPDGRSFDIDDVIEAETVVTQGGNAVEQSSNFAWIDDEFYWFTFCDQLPG